MKLVDHAIRLDPERAAYRATNDGMHTIVWDWVASTFHHSRPAAFYNPISQAIQKLVGSPLPPIRHLTLPKG